MFFRRYLVGVLTAIIVIMASVLGWQSLRIKDATRSEDELERQIAILSRLVEKARAETLTAKKAAEATAARLVEQARVQETMQRATMDYRGEFVALSQLKAALEAKVVKLASELEVERKARSAAERPLVETSGAIEATPAKCEGDQTEPGGATVGLGRPSAKVKMTELSPRPSAIILSDPVIYERAAPSIEEAAETGQTVAAMALPTRKSSKDTAKVGIAAPTSELTSESVSPAPGTESKKRPEKSKKARARSTPADSWTSIFQF